MMWHLVGDFGGTNLRLAMSAPDGSFHERESFDTRSTPSLADLCRSYVGARATRPVGAVVSGAGVVSGGMVTLTNTGQTLSETELRDACGTDNVKVLNDFEAAAWSLVTIRGEDVTTLQGPTAIPDGPRVIIGPGTGLGVGALVWAQGRPQVVPGEGGHVAIAPRSVEEVDYFAALTELWPDVQIGNNLAVEAEALLSGTGIPFFYRAVAKARAQDAPLTDAREIFAAGRAGDDAAAAITVDIFRAALGALAGDLGLVFDAKGGVFLTGGVALSNPWLFDDAFMAAFRAGGRHSGWRAQLPVYLHQNHDFGLNGARNYIASREGSGGV